MSGRRGSSSSRSYGFPPEAFDPSTVPEIAKDYPDPEGLLAFAKALDAPNRSPSNGITSPSSTSFARSPRLSEAGDSVSDLLSADGRAASIPDIRQSISLTQQQPSIFISAQNDWAPVNKKVRKPSRSADSHQGRHGKKASASPTRALLGERTKDETREGILYTLFKWPLFLTVASVVIFEWVCYLFTRVYIWLYEQMFAELGVGAGLRRQMRAADTYDEWVTSAKELDEYLGRELWKRQNKYAYYDASVVDRVRNGMNHYRNKAERLEGKEGKNVKELRLRLMGEIKGLAETSVRNNFLGVEGPRLYSQTYYGTKHLVQRYVDEGKHFLLLLPPSFCFSDLCCSPMLTSVLQSVRQSTSFAGLASCRPMRSVSYLSACTRTTAAQRCAFPAAPLSPTTTSASSKPSSMPTSYPM